jgi:hypothetical protein
VDAALLIIGVALVLTVFAPVAPPGTARSGLRTRLARQLHLWDRYLLNPPDSEPWRRGPLSG